MRLSNHSIKQMVDSLSTLGRSISKRADFPAPVDRWARGGLWAAVDVRRWARTYEGGAARWGER